jgi:pentatricopeptide repeat protein
MGLFCHDLILSSYCGLDLQLDDAENALREVEKKCNVKAEASVFNILIDFCCRQGEVSRGLDFLDEMQQRGLELSTFSFNPFIREFGRWSMVDEVHFTLKILSLPENQ